MDKNNTIGMKPKYRLIRLPEVLSRTGYGRTSIYRKMEKGTFPKCLKLDGPPAEPNKFDCRAIAWIEDEVDQWIESRIKERNSDLKIHSPTVNIKRKKSRMAQI